MTGYFPSWRAEVYGIAINPVAGTTVLSLLMPTAPLAFSRDVRLPRHLNYTTTIPGVFSPSEGVFEYFASSNHAVVEIIGMRREATVFVLDIIAGQVLATLREGELSGSYLKVPLSSLEQQPVAT
jgi:hypothetical protein